MDHGRRAARASLGIVHHTDAEREYAYDRKSQIGKLDKALDEAHGEGLDRRRHEAGLEDDFSVREAGVTT